jgi:hypothetical protein
MAYEKYKIIATKDQYYATWDKENVDMLSESLKEMIYQKYLLKCIVFQRDNFKCQNVNCKHPESKITLHHIKFKKNNGKDKPKNAVTICKPCHAAYHQGKAPLTFCGMTYRLQKQEGTIDWKAMKANGKKLREKNKEHCGFKISWKLLEQLMKFLDKEYTEIFDGVDDD